MNKIIVALLSLFLVSACATYGNYNPAVDDSIYNETSSTPPQQLFQSQQVFDKHGKPVLDKHGKPTYKQVPVVNENGQPVYQQSNQSQHGPRNSASQDAEQCREMAKNAASTGTEALKGGAVGGLIGAAGGAALGAAMGSAGTGAALGAAAGGIGGGAYTGLSADQDFKKVYKNCMRNRGHNVIDWGLSKRDCYTPRGHVCGVYIQGCRLNITTLSLTALNVDTQ